MIPGEYLIDDGDGHIVKWQSWPNWWGNDAVPDAVGVPEITPVEAARLSPAGSEPEMMLQV